MPQTISRLEPWEMVRQSINFLFGHRVEFLKIAAVPYALVVIGTGIGTLFPTSGWAAIISILVEIFFMGMLGVKWHRFFLLGPEAVKRQFSVEFGCREAWFCIYLALIFGLNIASDERLTTLISIPSGTLLYFYLATVVPVMFVVGRTILVLPAVALDFGQGFRADIVSSWRCMRGNTFNINLAFIQVSLIFWAIFVPLLPLALMIGILIPIEPSVRGALANGITIVFGPLFLIAGAVLTVTIISIAFDRLTDWRDGNLVEGDA